MAETSYPSPNHNSRNVTDKEYENISAFYGDGVHGNPSDGDVVSAGTGLQVLVKAGTRATLRGHVWDAGTSDVPLTISTNSGSATRYDWIVLRLDRSTWDVSAHVVEGTPGAGYPATADDTGDTGAYDLALALVSVTPGAGIPTIIQATRFAPRGITPATSGNVPFGSRPGEVQFRPDTGALELWDGNKWSTVSFNSGWLDLGAGYSTWEDYARTAGVRYGNTVHLRIAKRRVNSTLSAQDAESKIATLPDILTPRTTQYFPAVFSGKAGHCIVHIGTDGVIQVWETDKDVTPGRVLLLSCSYPIE